MCFLNQRRFRIVGRLNDGAVRWRGWFDSREDADAFLLAIGRFIVFGEPVPREIWQLPEPAWHPDFGENLEIPFLTVQFITSPTTGTSSFSIPADWTSTNSLGVIGGGGGVVQARAITTQVRAAEALGIP